jgi:hypothetical protein
MSLAKVTFIKSVKVCRYGLCGCVAACYIKCAVCCAEPLASLHEKQRTQIHNMLPQHYYNETLILLTRDFN